MIAPALAHPKGSRARGEAIAAAAEIERFLPGRPAFRVSARTIQRKLDAFEATGDLASLSRRRRADAGQKAVIVSRRRDRAVALDDADKQRIAKALRDYVRGLQVKGEGAALMAEIASTKLAALTRAAGVELGATALTACRVPSHLIDAERVYRRVHLLKSDRKAFEDQKPRILRKLADEPMEVVYGDVHPVDIVLLRDDGSQVHARAIGWLDDATRRIWIDLVLLEKGKGVTNAHVIRSFIAMASAWGLPKTLYLDNGAEYNFADFITDAMRLRDASSRFSKTPTSRPFPAGSAATERTRRLRM